MLIEKVMRERFHIHKIFKITLSGKSLRINDEIETEEHDGNNMERVQIYAIKLELPLVISRMFYFIIELHSLLRYLRYYGCWFCIGCSTFCTCV